MDEAAAGLHGVLGEGANGGVEGFGGEEVVDSRWGAAEEGGVALGEVGDSTESKGISWRVKS